MTYAIRSRDTRCWCQRTRELPGCLPTHIYQQNLRQAMVFRKKADAEAMCAKLYHCEVVRIIVAPTDGLPVRVADRPGRKPGSK